MLRLKFFVAERFSKAQIGATLKKSVAKLLGRPERKDTAHEEKSQSLVSNPIEDLFSSHFQLKSVLSIIAGGVY